MLNDRFYKMSVHEYSDGMPYGELRIQRQIKVPEAEKDKRLPTLEEAMSFLEKEWNKGKGFDVGRYRYESGISYPLTEKGLQAFNSFWFENRLFSHRIKDEVLATRLISGWGARAEASSHYPAGIEDGSMLITHGLALFDPENNMEVVKWYFDLHSHPGNSYRANMADLKIGMQNSMHSFIVSEKGILLYGGEVDVTLDDLARIGIELYEEDRKLLSQNVHIANSIDKYVSQITELAGRNYYKLDLFGGEDAEMVSDYLGIPFRLYKWGSEEIKDVLAYINGDDKALPYFNRRSFEEKFFLPKLPNA